MLSVMTVDDYVVYSFVQEIYAALKFMSVEILNTWRLITGSP